MYNWRIRNIYSQDYGIICHSKLLGVHTPTFKANARNSIVGNVKRKPNSIVLRFAISPHFIPKLIYHYLNES